MPGLRRIATARAGDYGGATYPKPVAPASGLTAPYEAAPGAVKRPGAGGFGTVWSADGRVGGETAGTWIRCEIIEMDRPAAVAAQDPVGAVGDLGESGEGGHADEQVEPGRFGAGGFDEADPVAGWHRVGRERRPVAVPARDGGVQVLLGVGRWPFASGCEPAMRFGSGRRWTSAGLPTVPSPATTAASGRRGQGSNPYRCSVRAPL